MSSVYAGNEGHWENVPELHRRVAAEIIDGAQNVRPAKLPDAPLSTDPGREDWIEGSSLWGICAACACKDVAFRIAGKFNHPERGTQTIDELIALYDWHGSHHLAHITGLRDRMKWW